MGHTRSMLDKRLTAAENVLYLAHVDVENNGAHADEETLDKLDRLEKRICSFKQSIHAQINQRTNQPTPKGQEGDQMKSGYAYCRCRDCFDIVLAANPHKPPFCEECLEHGCDGLGECLVPGAYSEDEEIELPYPKIEAASPRWTDGS